MKPYLNVPFLPDDGYIDFLTRCIADLDSVHFSLLQNQAGLDSRIRIEPVIARKTVTRQLARLRRPRKYALLNSRFYSPDLLTTDANLASLVLDLEYFLDHGVIDGLVYCDHYLLQALADRAPALAAQLEAVPGVNMMLDSVHKVEAMLTYIDETGFRIPRKIILDRSLNRNLDALASTSLSIHQQFPDIKVEVLANEGCLPHCPFKLAHDAYIALANIDGQDQTQLINCSLGCMRIFDEQPYRLLQSPFIRPEDLDLYLYHVDTIKICGRTLGPAFLRNAITAYRSRCYDGNLLDLMDALSWLAERLYVDNRMLSFDFANMLSQCDNRCDRCGFCRELFETIAHPLPMAIRDMRATAD